MAANSSPYVGLLFRIILGMLFCAGAALAEDGTALTSALCKGTANVKDDATRHKWFIAAAKGDIAAMVGLLSNKSVRCADITDSEEGRTALMVAAAAGKTAVVKFLLLDLTPGLQPPAVRLRARARANGDTVLIAAAYAGDTELIDFILSRAPFEKPERMEAAVVADSTRDFYLKECLESASATCTPPKGNDPVIDEKLAFKPSGYPKGDEPRGARIERQVGSYDIHRNINISSKTKPPCLAGENWWCSVQASPTTPQLPDAIASPGAIPEKVLTAIRGATAPSLSYQTNTSPSPGVRSVKGQGQYKLQYLPDPDDRRLSLFGFAGFNLNKTQTKISANSKFASGGVSWYSDFSPEYSGNKVFALSSVSLGHRDDNANPTIDGKKFSAVDSTIMNMNAAVWLPLTFPRSIFKDLFKEYDKTYGYAPLTFGLQMQKQSDGITNNAINRVLYQYWRLDWIETIPWFADTFVSATRQWVSVGRRSGNFSKLGSKLWPLSLNYKVKEVPLTVSYVFSSGSDPLTALPFDDKSVSIQFKYTP